MKPVIHTETEPEIVSRITDLLISQKKKQSELMDYLGLHRNNFSEWKAGRNRSYLIYIDEIARYFEVSPTYLLRGVEDKDIINGSEEAQGIKNIEYNLADKVRELRAYLRLSRGVFAEPLKLSPSHIARFETGKSIPTEGTITSICEAFGVDPRYFAANGHMAVEEAADFIDHSELIPDTLEVDFGKFVYSCRRDLSHSDNGMYRILRYVANNCSGMWTRRRLLITTKIAQPHTTLAAWVYAY